MVAWVRGWVELVEGRVGSLPSASRDGSQGPWMRRRCDWLGEFALPQPHRPGCPTVDERSIEFTRGVTDADRGPASPMIETTSSWKGDWMRQ